MPEKGQAPEPKASPLDRALRVFAVGREARIRLALTELGTTFIKLGQNLSTRADLVGPALAQELSALQSDTPADSPEAVRRTVESELERPRPTV